MLYTGRYLFTFLLLVSTCQAFGQYLTNASVGSLIINGDIAPIRDPLNFVSFGVSRELNHHFQLEARVGLARAFGLDTELASTSQEGGYLVESTYAILNDNKWYPAYRNSMVNLDISANYIPEIGIPRLKPLMGIGIGMTKSSRNLNLLGPQDTPYTFDFSGVMVQDRSTLIKDSYDVTYETSFDEGSDLSYHINGQIGVELRLKEALFVRVELRHYLTTSDYLDVIGFQSATKETGNNDSVTIISVGFVGYLIKKDKKSY